MKSKKTSTNISVTNDNRHKILSSLLIISISATIFFIISFLVIHNIRLNQLREQYNTALKRYNDYIETYNGTLTNYNKLISGLSKNGLTVSDQIPEPKEQMEYDFDTFYNNGNYDFKTIKDKVAEVEEENQKLITKTQDIQIKYYNDQIDIYNADAEKYNTMVERFSVYPNITVSANIIIKPKITTAKPSWKTADIYFKSYNILEKEIYNINELYHSLCLNAYNDVIKDYNLVAEAYNEAVKNCSVEFIENLPKKVSLKNEKTDDNIRKLEKDILYSFVERNYHDTDLLATKYLVVLQITDPSEDFVIERLKSVPDITETAAVTPNNDPNGLLNKEGGYTSCIYFTIKEIDSTKVKGTGVVGKGTDAGGAVEIYATLEDALNRCDYLSQFDGTLLYSGSYAIIGTMVIRTSYKLTDKQQIDLTNIITEKLTALE